MQCRSKFIESHSYLVAVLPLHYSIERYLHHPRLWTSPIGSYSHRDPRGFSVTLLIPRLHPSCKAIRGRRASPIFRAILDLSRILEVRTRESVHRPLIHDIHVLDPDITSLRKAGAVDCDKGRDAGSSVRVRDPDFRGRWRWRWDTETGGGTSRTWAAAGAITEDKGRDAG